MGWEEPVLGVELLKRNQFPNKSAWVIVEHRICSRAMRTCTSACAMGGTELDFAISGFYLPHSGCYGGTKNLVEVVIWEQ